MSKITAFILPASILEIVYKRINREQDENITQRLKQKGKTTARLGVLPAYADCATGDRVGVLLVWIT